MEELVDFLNWNYLIMVVQVMDKLVWEMEYVDMAFKSNDGCPRES